MINKIVEIEQARLARLGYDSTVTAESITIANGIVNIPCGNSTYVLTDVSLSSVDSVSADSVVSIVSASDAILGTQRQLSQMGKALAHCFRRYIIVKTNNARNGLTSGSVAPYQLHFFRITPNKKTL